MSDRNIEVHEYEKMSHRDAKYTSFRLKINILNSRTVSHPKFWPPNVQCRKFCPKRRDSEQQGWSLNSSEIDRLADTNSIRHRLIYEEAHDYYS